jgi:hypothetical protein
VSGYPLYVNLCAERGAILKNRHEFWHEQKMDKPRGTSNLLNFQAVFFLLSFLGGGVVIFGTAPYGIGVSPDTYSYYLCAKNIASGNGFVSSPGNPYTTWPPLFPSIMAAIEILGYNSIFYLKYLHAIVFSLILFSSGGLYYSSFHYRPFVFIAILWTIASNQIIQVTMWAWSEPVFILLTILFLRTIYTFITSKKIKYLLLAALFAALASLQRYIGITLFISGAICILFLTPKLKLISKLKKILVFSLVSLSPLFLWLARNYYVSGHLTGSRKPAVYSLWHYIEEITRILTLWFFPEQITLPFRLLVIALILIPFFLLWFQKRQKLNAENVPDLKLFLVLFIFTTCYISFVAVSASITFLDAQPTRYLVPVYIPIILMVFMAAELLYIFFNILTHNKVLPILFLIALSASCLYPINSTYDLLSYWRENGAGLTGRVVKDANIIKWLQQNTIKGKIYSNFPEILILNNDLNAVMSPSHSDDLAILKKKIKEENKKSYLVWINFFKRDHLLTPYELSKQLFVKSLYTFPDGYIFLIRENKNGL